MRFNWKTAIATAAAGIGLSWSATAIAQDYPQETVRIIVPWDPGGTTDIMGRLIAAQLQEELGGAFIVENRAGASSAVGGGYVSRARPDGHTLMFSTGTTVVMNPILTPDTPYGADDFVGVASISSGAFAFVGNNDFPAKTIEELIAMAEENPGRITYATNGPGTTTALIGALIESGLDVDLLPVPYTGASPAMTALLAGEVNANIEAVTVAYPNISEGMYFAYAVAATERHPLLPDVPTFAELGYSDVIANSWQGLYAPAGTPPEIIETLNEAIARALEKPEVRDRLTTLGQQPDWRPVAETQQYIAEEIARWTAVVEAIPAE